MKSQKHFFIDTSVILLRLLSLSLLENEGNRDGEVEFRWEELVDLFCRLGNRSPCLAWDPGVEDAHLGAVLRGIVDSAVLDDDLRLHDCIFAMLCLDPSSRLAGDHGESGFGWDAVVTALLYLKNHSPGEWHPDADRPGFSEILRWLLHVVSAIEDLRLSRFPEYASPLDARKALVGQCATIFGDKRFLAAMDEHEVELACDVLEAREEWIGNHRARLFVRWAVDELRKEIRTRRERPLVRERSEERGGESRVRPEEEAMMIQVGLQ